MVIDYEARRQYMKEYYKKNKERLNERQRRYMIEHAEERRQYRRERYQAHRDMQISRVKLCQAKKYHRGPNGKTCNVYFENYKDEYYNAKTRWAKKEVLKKFKRYQHLSMLGVARREKKKHENAERERLRKASK